eukprot:4343796-Amphidinium_carterae.1
MPVLRDGVLEAVRRVKRDNVEQLSNIVGGGSDMAEHCRSGILPQARIRAHALHHLLQQMLGCVPHPENCVLNDVVEGGHMDRGESACLCCRLGEAHPFLHWDCVPAVVDKEGHVVVRVGERVCEVRKCHSPSQA